MSVHDGPEYAQRAADFINGLQPASDG